MSQKNYAYEKTTINSKGNQLTSRYDESGNTVSYSYKNANGSGYYNNPVQGFAKYTAPKSPVKQEGGSQYSPGGHSWIQKNGGTRYATHERQPKANSNASPSKGGY